MSVLTFRGSWTVEKCDNRNLLKYRKEKCQVLHVVRNDPSCQYRLAGSRLAGKQVDQKAPGGFMDTSLNVSQQNNLATRKDKGILGCMRRSVANRSMEMIFPLSSALVGPHWVLGPVPGSPVQERHGLTGQSQGTGHKGDLGMGAYLLWEKIERGVKLWNRLPREVMETLSLGIYKRGQTRWSPNIPSNLK